MSLETICDVTRVREPPPGAVSVRARAAVGDRIAAWVASQQLALITAAQFRAAGVSKDAITTRCHRRSLHRVHQSVYLFGPPTFLPGARELAAVLACGDSALLSNRAAAGQWGMARSPDDVIDVTIVGASRRQRDGIRVHRATAIYPSERRLLRGIPITSPARTLLDFAAEARSDELERALAEAFVQRLTNERELGRALARNPNRAGAEH